MKRWSDLEHQEPELAEAGRQLFYQFGVGLGFLATVRKDGGPRLHPICPIITNGGLYGFIVPSPKRGDLHRDGRYALHSFPPADNDDEFYVAGRARVVNDPGTIREVDEAYQNEVSPEEELFEFLIERCLLARYRERGAFPPTYTNWRADQTL